MGHLNDYLHITSGEEYFHGEYYYTGEWGTSQYTCCRLCKTKNPNGKYTHWARGLCRSCYRRLSIQHRLYNDNWNKFNLLVGGRRNPTGKKEYKQFESLKFEDLDIETLLDRYDWRCAYSKIPLQGYNHTLPNAFQLEYHIKEDFTVELVPICRYLNCSKRSIEDKERLEHWAKNHNLIYPFNFINAGYYCNTSP